MSRLLAARQQCCLAMDAQVVELAGNSSWLLDDDDDRRRLLAAHHLVRSASCSCNRPVNLNIKKRHLTIVWRNRRTVKPTKKATTVRANKRLAVQITWPMAEGSTRTGSMCAFTWGTGFMGAAWSTA